MNNVLRVCALLVGGLMMALAGTGCESIMALLFLGGVESEVVAVEVADSIYDTIPQSRLEDGGFVLGSPEAPVTIVEFSDFLCPHCQSFTPTINQVVAEFVVNGQARLEFRMLATQAASPNLFQLAECVDQSTGSNFWEAHDVLFVLAVDRVPLENIGVEAANRLGISYDDIGECVDGLAQNLNGQYYADVDVAVAAQVTGTPTLRVRYGAADAPIQDWPAGNDRSFEAIRDVIVAANE